MWEKIKRIEVVFALIASAIVILGFVSGIFQSVVAWLLQLGSDILTLLFQQVAVSRVVLLILAIIVLLNILKAIKSIFDKQQESTLKEPTHETDYQGVHLFYYIDDKTGIPVVVPPMSCAECRASLNLKYVDTAPHLLLVGCINGHYIAPIAFNQNASPEKHLLDFYLMIKNNFEATHKMELTSQKIQEKQTEKGASK